MAHQQAVDGEIAAGYVFFGGFLRKRFDSGVAAVGIAEIGAECGYFYFYAVFWNQDDSELCTYSYAAGEELHYAIRGGVGGDVEVGGFAL